MDDPSDFAKHRRRALTTMKFGIGDLVCFTCYQYTPDYIYIDEEDFHLGVVLAVNARTYYQSIYTVHWFKKNRVTEVIEEHLSLVDKQFSDYL